MADFSSMTSKFRTNTRKNGSTEASTSKITKRPRLVCTQCHRSKLRCDRGHPCSNCIKKDEAAACNYDRPSGVGDNLSRRSEAGDRLSHLESMVKQLIQSQSQALTPPHNNETTRDASPVRSDGHTDATGFSNVRLENKQYVGSTHWSAVLDDIHDLKVILGRTTDAQDEVADFLPNDNCHSSEPIFGLPEGYSLDRILTQYLPAKVEVDRHLSKYFQGETFIVPFIHTYHFQRQYRGFWKDTASVNPLWLSMLFSMCHLASSIGRDSRIPAADLNGSVNESSQFNIAAGQCLVLGRYHRPQPYAVEALALYAHSKNLKTLNTSRDVGAILGIVVRMSYEMGYHRDPDSFGSFSVFEGEMRRRFWASVKQMDLMISFQLGLPSNINLEHCDTKSPRNLLDSDFDEDTLVLPSSRSENEPTKLLWFIVKERQLVTFAKVCQVALSVKEKSEADIRQLDEEVREMHTTIPDILRARPIADSIADTPFIIMTRLYIEFIHLKSLCVLHRKYMARGHDFSTRSCIDAGIRLVSRFVDMHNEHAPGGQLYNERWMLTNYTMNDFLLGVMVLCLAVHTRRRRGAASFAFDTTTENKVLLLLEQSHTICLEKSTMCTDARRVSHAIRLTLKSANTSRIPLESQSQPFNSGLHIDSILQPASDHTSGDVLSFQLPSSFGQGEEAAFGILDPFNFTDHDFESMDWAIFDL